MLIETSQFAGFEKQNSVIFLNLPLLSKTQYSLDITSKNGYSVLPRSNGLQSIFAPFVLREKGWIRATREKNSHCKSRAFSPKTPTQKTMPRYK